MKTEIPKRIVVIGAGFAGLTAVKHLSNEEDVEIVLIDRHNYHTFVPLLYQVATGFIEPELIAYPLRTILRRFNKVNFLMEEVEQIDFENRTVITGHQSIKYDYLVIATGSKTNFLNVVGAPEHTFPLRTMEDALTLRNHIIHCLELAVKNQNDICYQQRLMTFIIVGGGPTGVEMAGALQELIQDCLSKDYPQLNWQQARVILLQSGSTLLSNYPLQLQKYTITQLRSQGVQIYFDSRVQVTTTTEVILEDETSIATSTIVWTAGVEASYPEPQKDIRTASKNKVKVLNTLQLPDFSQVYAIGDVAHVEQGKENLLGIAPEALQQGKTIADNIKRQLKGKNPLPFNYFNKGTAAIIARNAGVAYLFGKIPLKGFLAWFLWLGIHVYYLPGISNRLKIIAAWLKDYFFRDRSIKQIMRFKYYSTMKQQHTTHRKIS